MMFIGDCRASLWYEWAAEGLNGEIAMSLLLTATSAGGIMGDVWLESQQMVWTVVDDNTNTWMGSK